MYLLILMSVCVNDQGYYVKLCTCTCSIYALHEMQTGDKIEG
jgi:hypothetical protein